MFSERTPEPSDYVTDMRNRKLGKGSCVPHADSRVQRNWFLFYSIDLFDELCGLCRKFGQLKS